MSKKRGLKFGGILIIIAFIGYIALITTKPPSKRDTQQPTDIIEISKDSATRNPAAKIYQKALKNQLKTKQELLSKKSRI